MSSAFPEELDDFPASSVLRQHTLGQDPHSVLHGNIGEAIEALEVVTVGPVVFNVKGYGAVGDGSTNDTAAVQAAITAATASVGGGNHSAIVYFPQGAYRVDPITSIIVDSLTIQGAGYQSTHIYMNSGTALFTLGSFNAAASATEAYYIDIGSHFSIRDLYIDGLQYATANGSRTTTAVVDNGAGNVTFSNVFFRGLQYGLKASYGSDLNRIDNCNFQYCDVGIYLGPGSDQNLITSCSFEFGGFGIITEGVNSAVIEMCSFVSQATAGYRNEHLTTNRIGLSNTTPQARTEGKILLKGCWFECDNTRPSAAFVHNIGDFSLTRPRGLTIENSTVIAGGSTGSQIPFVYVETGRDVSVSDTVVQGNYCSSIVKRGTNGNYIRQERSRTVEGYTPVPWWESANNTCVGEGLGGGELYTFTSGDTTPSVQLNTNSVWVSRTVFKAASTSSVTITVFDDGYIGQRITLMSTNGNTSFANGSGILTRTAGTVTLGTNSTTAFVYDGSNWFQEF